MVKGYGRDHATMLELVGHSADTGHAGPDLWDVLAGRADERSHRTAATARTGPPATRDVAAFPTSGHLAACAAGAESHTGTSGRAAPAGDDRKVRASDPVRRGGGRGGPGGFAR